MGIFSTPVKPLGECTAEDYVDAAIRNLEMWKQNGADKNYDYLIFTFAIPYLNDAMRKLRPLNDT